jgi:hypothetical protein
LLLCSRYLPPILGAVIHVLGNPDHLVPQEGILFIPPGGFL